MVMSSSFLSGWEELDQSREDTPHEASESGYGGGRDSNIVHHIETKVVEVEPASITNR